MENYKPAPVPIKMEKDNQIVIPFGEDELKKDIYKEETEDAVKVVQKLNLKYPKAKLNPSIVEPDGNGGYIVSKMHFTLSELEEYMRGLDESENTDSGYWQM